MTASETNLPSRLAEWPVEGRVLMQLLRVALGTEKAFQWPAGLDMEKFRECVQRHRVGAFLHQRLGEGFHGLLPDAARQHLREVARHTATLALARSGELVHVTRIFHAAGVQFVSVKGPLLAQALYGEVGGRHAGDLDLLISPDQLASADQVLRAAGYRRSQPGFELTPRQWHEYQRLKHEFEYFNDAVGVRIEVQWRLEGLPSQPLAGWLARGERQIFGGEELARLPAETEFLYLFVHGARHAWTALFWLLDLGLLFKRDGLDWQRLMQAAIECGAELAVWQGGWLAEALLGIPLPNALRVPLDQQVRVRWLAMEAMRLMRATAKERGGTVELFRQTHYQLRLRPGWRGAASVLQSRLMSPSSWQALPLPDRWFALYYVAGPFLWLRRRIGRKAQ